LSRSDTEIKIRTCIDGPLCKPSSPFRGERERPTAQRWEGEVGAGNRAEISRLAPALSAAEAGEGDRRSDPTDIRHGDRVARWLPHWAEPYARLARLDRPIGTWLLLFPAWWGIALASSGLPDPVLLLLFAVGAVAMRGAGCTLNDIADRHYDGRVARTRLRPLPSGRVTVRQAVVFMLAQLAVGAAILLSLDRLTIVLGVAVLALIGTYPFMKRVTWWPQLFLGLNFNWGALIGWAAVAGSLAWPAVLLYFGGIFWTLGYDTIYAHQDKEDDARIGVKSSALALGPRTRPFLFAFYAAATLLWGAGGAAAGVGAAFWAFLVAAAVQLLWQAARVDIDDPVDCLGKFRSNRIVGWLVFAGIIAGHFV
jgi:4-hydroxybenzoate polyprenyltransferase